MSQAGEIDVVANNPDIPINFVTDDGNAVPIGNTLEILGIAVSAGSTPVETTGSGNTVTVKVQRSQGIPATDATKIGLAAFDSAKFNVDVNGFVTLNSSALGVLTVTGTLNRITSTGGQNPVIDISASYVGQTSITTLGTITTGTWNGTVVALSFGGTNANLTASNGGIFYSTSTAGAILAGTATAGQVLRSGASSAPSWSTATFPATATSAGTILRADGTNWVASTSTYPNTNAVNTLLYASSANIMAALPTANNAVLGTDGSGVPSITTTPRVTSITFDGTNQLSTYSVGTFTPTITGSGSNPTPTYTAQNGYYTKIGKMVFFSCFVSVSALTGGTGNVQVSGLPFTSENQTNEKGYFSGTSTINSLLTTAVVQIAPNATLVNMIIAAGTALLQLPQTTLTTIQFGGCYQATS